MSDEMIFAVDDDLRRIVAHARDQGGDVLLVKDQGIYLMARGLLRDDNPPGQTRHLCVYAQGCDPDGSPDWYDRARDLAGGDDFVEEFAPSDLALFIDKGASQLMILASESHISIRAA